MLMDDPDSAQVGFDTAIEVDMGKSTVPYIEAAKLEERLGQRQPGKNGDAVGKLELEIEERLRVERCASHRRSGEGVELLVSGYVSTTFERSGQPEIHDPDRHLFRNHALPQGDHIGVVV